MKLGTYELENYTININGVDEVRQNIIYYDNFGDEITKESYRGEPDDIKEGYTMTDGTPRRVQRWQFKSQLALEPSPVSGYTSLKEYTIYLLDQLTGSTKIIAAEAWESANYISYYSPTVSYISTMAGLADSDVRRIFKDASNIQI